MVYPSPHFPHLRRFRRSLAALAFATCVVALRADVPVYFDTRDIGVSPSFNLNARLADAAGIHCLRVGSLAQQRSGEQIRNMGGLRIRAGSSDLSRHAVSQLPTPREYRH